MDVRAPLAFTRRSDLGPDATRPGGVQRAVTLPAGVDLEEALDTRVCTIRDLDAPGAERPDFERSGFDRIDLSRLASLAAAQGGDELIGEYLPTAKNRLVEDFYPNHGFTASGENRWQRKLSNPLATASYIEVDFHER